MATKSLFRQTLDEIAAETHIFIQKYTDILDRVQAILDRKGMSFKTNFGNEVENTDKADKKFFGSEISKKKKAVSF